MSSRSGSTKGLLADLVSESLAMNIDADWVDASLYTPYLNDQALVYEYADCLAAQTFLRMAGLPYNVRQRPNAEYISPTGRVPVLRMKNLVVPEFASIVDVVAKKGVNLAGSLNDSQRAELAAHLSLLDYTLRNVEMFVMWKHPETYLEVTKGRYGGVYHWPLSVFLPALKRREISASLDDQDWGQKSLTDVINQADRVFHSLSSQLGTQKFLMGDRPTELDALAFGHLYTILTTRLPCMDLANTLKKYTNLVDYVKKIETDYFKQ